MPKPLTDRIEHIVVLMLENRSFDNVFGGLYPETTRAGGFRGLTGAETNPIDPSRPESGSVQVFQGPAADATWITPYPDPGELHADIMKQLYGTDAAELPNTPPMSGFVWNYLQQPGAPEKVGGAVLPPAAANIMQYYSGATMPVSWYLAQAFAVCDTWFASGPVQTYANRIFAHCGTPGRVPGTNAARVDNPDFMKGVAQGEWLLHAFFSPPVTELTVFEALDRRYPPAQNDKAQNWKVYYHDVPISAMCKYVYDHWHHLRSLTGGNVFPFENFAADVRAGTLPKYSFIEPRYTDFYGGTVNSNHPGGAGIDFTDTNGSSLPPAIDVRAGEILLNEIYSLLHDHPDLFDRTLFVVTYDEHGGLYDHQPPPRAVSPFAQPVSGFAYERYGVRVPTLLINPFVRRGSIYPPRTPFASIASPPHDHTSLIKTVLQQFDATGDFGPRVAAAPAIAGIVTDERNLPAPPPNPQYVPVPSPLRERIIANFHPHAPTLAGGMALMYKHIEDWKKKSSA